MEAFYDNQPAKLEAVGNGSYIYRLNIQEVAKQSTNDEEEAGTQWKCEEVTIWAPLTSDKITEAVITSKWNSNYEQKLVNEYNSAMLGLYSEEESELRIQSYKSYLTERIAIKTQIDADCAELGIL